MKQSLGFTLIELIIAVSIMAILSIAGVFSYNSIRTNTRDQTRLRDLQSVKQALEVYRTDNRQYPTDLSSLVPKYITAIPHDPQYNASDNTSPDYRYSRISATNYVFCGLKESANSFTAPSGCSSLSCAGNTQCNIGVTPQ